MKNIQVIDGAENCTYSIYAATTEEFYLIFPENQDIEFADDLFKRLGEEKANCLLSQIWNRLIDKKQVNGIHGTLFYQLNFKKNSIPQKKIKR